MAIQPASPPSSITIQSPWRTFGVTGIGVVLVFANMTTIDVSLPSVIRGLDATPTQGNWILLGYMIAITTLVLAFGRLADLVDRKQLYMAGLGLFSIASLVCGLAPSPEVMIAARLAQATGAAIIMTNNVALLADAFPMNRLPLALGFNATLAAMASVSGPLIGGALVTWIGWRSTFLVLVPLGLIALLLSRKVLHSRPGRKEPFDITGTMLSALALSSLVYGLSEAGALGWLHWHVVLAAIVAATATLFFLVSQRRAKYPLLDLTLISKRPLLLSYCANFAISAVQISAILLLSLYLQAAKGFDAFEAGIGISPFAFGLMASALFAGWLMRRVSGDLLTCLGMSIVALALACLAITIAHELHGIVQLLAIGAIGIGVGMFTTPNTSAILSNIPASQRGMANGLRSMTQNCGFVIGSALSLAIVTSPLSQEARIAIYSGLADALAPDQSLLLQDQYVKAFLLLAGLSILGLACCISRAFSTPRQPSRQLRANDKFKEKL